MFTRENIEAGTEAQREIHAPNMNIFSFCVKAVSYETTTLFSSFSSSSSGGRVEETTSIVIVNCGKILK